MKSDTMVLNIGIDCSERATLLAEVLYHPGIAVEVVDWFPISLIKPGTI
jgi:hypothetical protein